VKLDPLGHALKVRVLTGDLHRVARLIGGAPDVDAGGPAAGESLGRHQQHRAAAASDVEEPLVSFELEPVEQLGPDGELARAGGVDEAARVEKQPERAHTQGCNGNSIGHHRNALAVPKPPHREGEEAKAAEGH